MIIIIYPFNELIATPGGVDNHRRHQIINIELDTIKLWKGGFGRANYVNTEPREL